MLRCFARGLFFALSMLMVSTAVSAAFPVAVTDIVFDGLAEIDEKDVRDVIVFEVGDEIRESDLRSAAQSIHDLGWFREVVPDVSDDGVVVFRVVEYPVIDEIVITGNVNKRSYSLFGVELFQLRIMPTATIKQTLRREGIRKGRVLNRSALETALMKVISDYNERGYVLVSVGDVAVSDRLAIEFVEGRVVGNLIQGLTTVPQSVPEKMIDLPLGEPLLQADAQRVMVALRDSVYFSDVAVVPEASGASDEVLLNWTLTERVLVETPIEFDAITLTGVDAFPMDIATDALGEIPAGPVDNYGMLCVVEGLYDLYQREGYLMVRFSVAGLDGGTLRFRVEEGVLSEILLSGNTRTEDYVVFRNLGFEVGDVVTWSDLRVAYQRLNSFDYFETIDLLPEWSDDGVRLFAVITEKDSLGGVNGALTVDPNSGGILGEVSIAQKNLFGKGQDVSLTYDRGLVSTEEEPMESSWTLGYDSVARFPGFDRVGVDVYRTIAEVEENDETSEYLTVGGTATFDYPIGDYTDLSIGYTHDDVHLIGSDEWTTIATVNLALVYNDADDPSFPTAGDRRSLSIAQAGGFAPGEEFTKLGLLWIRYEPVPGWVREWDQVLALRFYLAWGSEDLSASSKYSLGGSATVRGAETESVTRMLIANLEHRLQLTEGLVLTAFLDAGVDLNSIRVDDAMASTGLEIGIQVAGMHLRLDFAWVLGDDLDWMPTFDFGFGPMF